MWDFLTAIFCALFGGCHDGDCRTLTHANVKHTVCSYSVAEIETRLFLTNPSGEPFARLSRLQSALERKSRQPLMLMNGGMYHDDLSPVGLYVEGKRESQQVSTKGGWGNFHLLPNGVFWGRDGKLGVSETKAFLKADRKVDFATQSGPMLVIDGKLHPRFLKESDSLKIRNGVGVSKDGSTVHFVISHGVINFWNFGKLFQDELKAPNALFLDGTVSAIKTKTANRGGWRPLGPMIGVFARK
jgi:uncharacterized protein YigE (DUF2233 family)